MEQIIQYDFGVMCLSGIERQTLRVKSTGGPCDLTPDRFYTVTEHYPDMTAEHSFRIERMMKEDTDREGHTYRWYVLAEHNTSTDRSPAALMLGKQNAANLDYLSMMSGIDLPTELEAAAGKEVTDND